MCDSNCESAALQAGMTVEACLVIPVFLLFMMSILYFFQIVHLQTQVIQTMHQEGNRLSYQAYGSRESLKQEYIILQEEYQIRPFLFWMDFGNLIVSHQYYGHAWVGYDAGKNAGNQVMEEYVYIAESGTVYHRRRDCTYLDLSVRSVSRADLSGLRNRAGGNYYKCELCDEQNGNICYITDYGNRYHSNPVCSGLKRTIFLVLLGDAVTQGRHGCSKCS